MSVVREVRMECTGATTVTKNGVEREVVNNKQYTIEIVVEGHQYKVMPNWGAIGGKPARPKEEKQKLEIYASLAAATGILEKTLVDKKKKGYVVVRDSGIDTAGGERGGYEEPLVNTAFKPAGAGSSAKERKTTDETADATADVPPSSKKKRPAKQAVGDEKEATGGAKSAGKGSKKAAPEKEDEPAEKTPASKKKKKAA